MREIQPAVLLRESSAQLIMYSLDTHVSTYSLIFKSQKGSNEALDFLIGCIIISSQFHYRLHHNYLITTEK